MSNFSMLKGHQAHGAYGCDDCCHVMFEEKAWVEYGNIAKVKDAMMRIDPYHFVFGTIACDNLWMWSEVRVFLWFRPLETPCVPAVVPGPWHAAHSTRCDAVQRACRRRRVLTV